MQQLSVIASSCCQEPAHGSSLASQLCGPSTMVNFQTICQLAKDASSAVAFLTCCALATPQCKCPLGHHWSLHAPAKKEKKEAPRPYFWCKAVVSKEKVAGKKKKKHCMLKRRLSDSSPLLRWLPQVSPDKLVHLMCLLTGLSHTTVGDSFRVFWRAVCSFT